MDCRGDRERIRDAIDLYSDWNSCLNAVRSSLEVFFNSD